MTEIVETTLQQIGFSLPVSKYYGHDRDPKMRLGHIRGDGLNARAGTYFYLMDRPMLGEQMYEFISHLSPFDFSKIGATDDIQLIQRIMARGPRFDRDGKPIANLYTMHRDHPLIGQFFGEFVDYEADSWLFTLLEEDLLHETIYDNFKGLLVVDLPIYAEHMRSKTLAELDNPFSLDTNIAAMRLSPGNYRKFRRYLSRHTDLVDRSIKCVVKWQGKTPG